MTADWQVGRSNRECALTRRVLEIGEVFFSGLVEEGDDFRREDYSAQSWGDIDKSGFFSYWKTKVQAPDEKKRLVIDTEAFYTFFSNLVEAADEKKSLFLYLVALILTRKRILRLDEIEKGPEEDTLVLFDRRADREIRIPCPDVTDDDLMDAQESLNDIFECQIQNDDL